MFEINCENHETARTIFDHIFFQYTECKEVDLFTDGRENKNLKIKFYVDGSRILNFAS